MSIDPEKVEKNPDPSNLYEALGIDRAVFVDLPDDEKRQMVENILAEKEGEPGVPGAKEVKRTLLDQDNRIKYELEQGLTPTNYFEVLGLDPTKASDKDIADTLYKFQKAIRIERNQAAGKPNEKDLIAETVKKMNYIMEVSKTLDGGENQKAYKKLVMDNADGNSDAEEVLPDLEKKPGDGKESTYDDLKKKADIIPDDFEFPQEREADSDALGGAEEEFQDQPPVKDMDYTEIGDELKDLDGSVTQCSFCKKPFVLRGGSAPRCPNPKCNKPNAKAKRLNQLLEKFKKRPGGEQLADTEAENTYVPDREEIRDAERMLQSILDTLRKYNEELGKTKTTEERKRDLLMFKDERFQKYKEHLEDIKSRNIKTPKIDKLKKEIEAEIIGGLALELEEEQTMGGPGDYEYEAMDTTGGEVRDVIKDANSEQDVRDRIRALGYFVVRVTLINPREKKPSAWAKVKGWWKSNAPTWAGGGQSPETGEGEESAETEFVIKPGVSTPAEYRADEDSDEYGTENEDTLLENPDKKIFGVFDGKGGGPLGEVASKMAAESVEEMLSQLPDDAPPEEIKDEMERTLIRVNQEIVDLVDSDPAKYTEEAGNGSIQGMGTSASVVKLWEGKNGEKKAIIGNVGDTRVYKYHADGTLEQITLDDNLVRATFKKEATARIKQKIFNNAKSASDITIDPEDRDLFRRRNGITQELGTPEGITPRMHIVDLQKGDKIIILCDGISDNLTDDEMAKILKDGGNIQALVNTSVERSREPNDDEEGRPKPDDMTGIIIEVSVKKKSKTDDAESTEQSDDDLAPPQKPKPATKTETPAENEDDTKPPVIYVPTKKTTTKTENDAPGSPEDGKPQATNEGADADDDDEDDSDTEGDEDEDGTEPENDGPGEYEYEALDKDGNEVTDTVDAQSEQDAQDQVKAKGLEVQGMKKKKGKKKTKTPEADADAAAEAEAEADTDADVTETVETMSDEEFEKLVEELEDKDASETAKLAKRSRRSVKKAAKFVKEYGPGFAKGAAKGAAVHGFWFGTYISRLLFDVTFKLWEKGDSFKFGDDVPDSIDDVFGATWFKNLKKDDNK